MEENFLGESIKWNVEAMIKDRIDEEIEEQVNKFREKLESQKDEFLAEIMKGIRITHSYDPMSCEMNYKIIFENVYKPKKTEATPYEPYTPVEPLDPLSINRIPSID